jgi:hypothetical protein
VCRTLAQYYPSLVDQDALSAPSQAPTVQSDASKQAKSESSNVTSSAEATADALLMPVDVPPTTLASERAPLFAWAFARAGVRDMQNASKGGAPVTTLALSGLAYSLQPLPFEDDWLDVDK